MGDYHAKVAVIEARHKAWLKLLDSAEKQLNARQWLMFDEDDDGEAFASRLREIRNELAELNDKAVALAARIQQNFEDLLA